MKKAFSRCYAALVLLFMYLPIFVLIAFSFNESKGRVWTGFTFKWYGELFRDREILGALGNTLIVALIASVCATILGTTAAFGIHCMKRRARTLIKNVNNMPLINPEIVIGISLLILFTLLKLRPGFLTLILAHITFCVPTVVLSVLPKLRQLNKNIYEAALDLGCTPFQSFTKVVIHEIMPGIISGALMAFTMSLDDFVISYFVTGSSFITLPVEIYNYTKKPIQPKIYALFTLMFIVILVLMVVMNLLQAKSEKNRQQPRRVRA